jgi:Zn-dependent protease with chaperone function
MAAMPAVALGAVLAVVAGPVIGVVVLVVVLAALAVSLWFASTSRALRRLGARDLRRSEEPRLVNVTQGLCATMGLAEPLVMIVDDAVPNACSVGRDEDDAVVVVTTGLVERLDLVALEGVLAHELAHVQRGETAVAGVVLAWAGAWCRLLGGERWVHRVVGHGREYRADQSAVATVRYPPGLRDALSLLAAGGAAVSGSRFSGPSWELTRWVWLDPTVGMAPGSAVGDLDDTAVRLAALEQY